MAKPGWDQIKERELGIKLLRRSLLATAWVAGLFSALVCGTLAFNHFTATANENGKNQAIPPRTVESVRQRSSCLQIPSATRTLA